MSTHTRINASDICKFVTKFHLENLSVSVDSYTEGGLILEDYIPGEGMEAELKSNGDYKIITWHSTGGDDIEETIVAKGNIIKEDNHG